MSNRPSVAIGPKIRKLRRREGYTQKQLAAKLSKSESAVRMWELGFSEPSLSDFKRLTEIFDVSADYLLK